MENAERFWSKIAKAGPDDCWHWHGGSHQRGYGVFWFEGKNVRANRHALTLAKGRPASADLMALHSCDNPPCCNPAHLRWGTAKDNADDRDLRHGAIRTNAKTDEAGVAEIYRLRLAGYTAGQIAEKLHYSKHHVMNIYIGRSWGHLLGFNGNPTLEELRASKPRNRSSSPLRLIKDDIVDDILRSRMEGQTARQIASRLGFPIGTISPVFCGLAYIHRLGVDGNPTFEELRSVRAVHPTTKLTEDDVIEIRALLAKGCVGRAIAERYDISPALVSLIRSGKR